MTVADMVVMKMTHYLRNDRNMTYHILQEIKLPVLIKSLRYRRKYFAFAVAYLTIDERNSFSYHVKSSHYETNASIKMFFDIILY